MLEASHLTSPCINLFENSDATSDVVSKCQVRWRHLAMDTSVWSCISNAVIVDIRNEMGFFSHRNIVTFVKINSRATIWM